MIIHILLQDSSFKFSKRETDLKKKRRSKIFVRFKQNRDLNWFFIKVQTNKTQIKSIIAFVFLSLMYFTKYSVFLVGYFLNQVSLNKTLLLTLYKKIKKMKLSLYLTKFVILKLAIKFFKSDSILEQLWEIRITKSFKMLQAFFIFFTH